jgi:hypothetical protein
MRRPWMNQPAHVHGMPTSLHVDTSDVTE